jgi:hypothetical protein
VKRRLESAQLMSLVVAAPFSREIDVSQSRAAAMAWRGGNGKAGGSGGLDRGGRGSEAAGWVEMK